MKILILTTSLNARSRSRVLAEYAHEVCTGAGAGCCLVDLQELDLPFCGTGEAEDHPQVLQLLNTMSLNLTHGNDALAPSRNWNLKRTSSGAATSPLKTSKYNSRPA